PQHGRRPLAPPESPGRGEPLHKAALGGGDDHHARIPADDLALRTADLTMRALTENVLVETNQRGSNHGLVRTSDGLVLIDGPPKPSDTLRLKDDIERRGPLRYILNTEPHGDHWTSNAYFPGVPVIAHAGVRERIQTTNMAEMVARVATFGPDEPALLV